MKPWLVIAVIFLGALTPSMGLAQTCVSASVPQVLASGLNRPLLLSVDSTTVYFRDDRGRMVSSVPKCGGPITVLASAVTGFNNSSGIAAFSGIVYFVDNGASTYGSGRLMSVSAGGGTPLVLASELNSPTGLAVDASGIYVGESPCCSARILKFDFAGNLVSVLANGLSGVSS